MHTEFHGYHQTRGDWTLEFNHAYIVFELVQEIARAKALLMMIIPWPHYWDGCRSAPTTALALAGWLPDPWQWFGYQCLLQPCWKPGKLTGELRSKQCQQQGLLALPNLSCTSSYHHTKNNWKLRPECNHISLPYSSEIGSSSERTRSFECQTWPACLPCRAFTWLPGFDLGGLRSGRMGIKPLGISTRLVRSSVGLLVVYDISGTYCKYQ